MSGQLDWNPHRVAAFFDDYGESEWTRFEEGRTPAPSLDVHLDRLRTQPRRTGQAAARYG